MIKMNCLTILPLINLSMRKSILFLFIFFSSCLLFAQNFPERSNRLVNDFTNTLSNEDVNALERKLVAYNDSTSTQVAIILIPSLEGYDVADYADRLAEKWGIGQKEKDNGVIILAAIQDRKVTIQTGYGMEGVLPDAICKRIIEYEITPEFKRGNFYQGLDNASTAIFKFAAGEYKADTYQKKGKKGFPAGLIILFFIIAIIAISRRKKRYQNIGTRGADIPFWMLMGGLGSGGGSHRGSWGNFSGGSGGFGGFGGGSFGGGGASGSW
jgi:uncharacterized protein